MAIKFEVFSKSLSAGVSSFWKFLQLIAVLKKGILWEILPL